MKVRYKQIKYSICGHVCSYYIKEYKHWWNLSWTIEMDGYSPAIYDLINGEYILRLV